MSDDDVFDVEAIKAKRVVSGRTEYLVKWKGYDEESWEPSSNILDNDLIKQFREQQNCKRGKGRPPKSMRKGQDNKKCVQKEVKPKDEEENEVEEKPSIRINETESLPENAKVEKFIKSESKRKVLNTPKIEANLDETRKIGEILDETCKTEDVCEDKVDCEVVRILGAAKINEEIFFLIQWKDENKEAEPISAAEANLKWPSAVIAFYEEHFVWVDK